MSTGMSLIKGYEKVHGEVQRVRTRKLTYTIFEIGSVDPVELIVKTSGGIDGSVDLRSTPSEQELVEIFEECKSQLIESKAFFVVYNFGYYNEKRNYREMIMLISFIPEQEGLRKKIAMASNMATLLNLLEIPIHIQSDELSEFTFDRLERECLSIQRK